MDNIHKAICLRFMVQTDGKLDQIMGLKNYPFEKHLNIQK
jgi:hypothetical protein